VGLRSAIRTTRQRLLSSLHQRAVPLGDAGPIVTITFDDFPRSALTVGGEILGRFHARATYYVAMGLMGTTNRLGPQFEPGDLRAAAEEGHELALHGYEHLSARRNSVQTLVRDLDKCSASMRQYIEAGATRNFAYPYGEATLAAKKTLGSRLASSRGTCPGINGPDVDLNLLRSNYLYGDTEQFESARQLILENQRRRGWLIFYTHDVAESPSPYGCTPSLLEKVMDFSVTQGAAIMTVAQVMTKLNANA